MFIELILLVFFTILIYLCLKTWRIYKLAKNIPAERAYPLIGHGYMFLEIQKMADLIPLVDRLSDKFLEYGITKIWLGPILIIGLFNPKYTKVIANSPYTVNRGDVFYLLAGDITNGVFMTSDGTKWKELRKPLIKSLMKTMIISDYHHVFVRRSKECVQYIRQHKLGVEFDIFQTMANLSLDIFSETHLGVQTNEVTDNKFNFVKNFDILLEAEVMNVIRFLIYFKKLGEHFAQLAKTFQRRKHEFNKFLQWVLDERMKCN